MSEDLEGLKVYVAMACRALARGVSAFKNRMQALRHHGRGPLLAEGRVRVHRASPRVRDGSCTRIAVFHAAQRRGLLHRRREVERRLGDGIVSLHQGVGRRQR